MQNPPLQVEAAVDVILAVAAHRSSNVAHQEFGKAIFDRYFIGLRAEVNDDAVASTYLDQLIAAMSSAVRAFSVARDIFGTNWQTLKKHHDHQLERADRILDYSPFKEKGVWGKAFGIVGGSGSALVIQQGFVRSIHNAPWILVAISVVGAACGLVISEWAINAYHDNQINKIEMSFPEELNNEWEAKTLATYRAIIKQFLVSGYLIQLTYYPTDVILVGNLGIGSKALSKLAYKEATVDDEAAEIDQLLDRITERHFAFRAA